MKIQIETSLDGINKTTDEKINYLVFAQGTLYAPAQETTGLKLGDKIKITIEKEE